MTYKEEILAKASQFSRHYKKNIVIHSEKYIQCIKQCIHLHVCTRSSAYLLFNRATFFMINSWTRSLRLFFFSSLTLLSIFCLTSSMNGSCFDNFLLMATAKKCIKNCNICTIKSSHTYGVYCPCDKPKHYHKDNALLNTSCLNSF